MMMLIKVGMLYVALFAGLWGWTLTDRGGLELCEGARCIRESMSWKPCGVVRSIATPLNEVFDTPSSTTVIDDGLHFVFHMIIDCDRGRSWDMGAER